MRRSIGIGGLSVVTVWAAAAMAGAAPAGRAKASKPVKSPATPVHLDLPCPALQGSVGLDVNVKGEEAVLRVEYPQPFASYRGRGEGLIDTRIYFDSDNDVRSGLEEWDGESLMLKGVDYSVEVQESADEEGDREAVNGHVLHSKVFKHDGSMASASGSFTSEYLGNVATFTVDLVELHARRGSLVKALFMVGKCGPASQTFRLGAAGPAAARAGGGARVAKAKGSAPVTPALSTPVHLDLPCPALEGSVGLDVDVQGENAVLRVAYPQPFASYRGRSEGLIDTHIYFDSDNDARSGLEEWDAESLKLKGADYEVAVREYPAEAGDAGAVNGHILHSKVFTHDGTVANATGSFESQYLGNVATFTVALPELHASRGTIVKTLFMVGHCGPVAQTLRLGAAAPAARKRR